ncbi:MAG TPA: hypothetical protein VF031_04945 [Alphaproteobacteria bacterium]
MARLFAGALTLLLLAGTAPALAEEERDPLVPDWRGSARAALEQLESALDSLQGMVDRLPSYGMPYLDEDGDIVIPRQEPLPPPRLRGPGDPDVVEI